MRYYQLTSALLLIALEALAGCGPKAHTASTTAGDPIIRQGLIAYYPFNGYAYDFSGNGNKGVPAGIVPAKDRFGDDGKAYSFDGKGAHITLPTAGELCLRDTSFSVSVWFRGADLENWDNDHAIIGMDGPADSACLHLLIRQQKPMLGFYNDDTYARSVCRSGEWYHLVYLYNKLTRTQAIYVNGALDTTGTDRAPMAGDGPVQVGRWCGDRYFCGEIDDIRIYGRVLSADEVLTLYHEGGWK